MNDSPPSFKTDVFSFGVVLWEILCRRSPHTSWLALIAKATKREMKDVDVGEIASAVCNKKRLPLPRDFAQLILDCWKHEPADRPTMEQVSQRLNAMVAHARGNASQQVFHFSRFDRFFTTVFFQSDSNALKAEIDRLKTEIKRLQSQLASQSTSSDVKATTVYHAPATVSLIRSASSDLL